MKSKIFDNFFFFSNFKYMFVAQDAGMFSQIPGGEISELLEWR